MNGEILNTLRGIDLKPVLKLKREFVAALVLIAFSLIFHRFVYLKNAKEIELSESEIRAASAEMSRIKSEMRAAEGLKKPVLEASASLASLEARLKGMNELLPSDRHLSRILSEISDSGKKGVRIVSIKPLPPEDRGEIARLPFQLTVEAGFTAFGNYLEGIEGLPRLITVDNFMLESKEEASSLLTAQIYLSAYVSNQAR